LSAIEERSKRLVYRLKRVATMVFGATLLASLVPSEPWNQAESSLRTPDPVTREHVVVAGDTLASIAERYYGDASLWPIIWAHNRGRADQVGHELADPELIYPGSVLEIPDPETAAGGEG